MSLLLIFVLLELVILSKRGKQPNPSTISVGFNRQGASHANGGVCVFPFELRPGVFLVSLRLGIDRKQEYWNGLGHSATLML